MVTKYFNREKYDIFRFNFINLHLSKEPRLGSLIFVKPDYLLNYTVFDNNNKKKDYNYLTLLSFNHCKSYFNKMAEKFCYEKFCRVNTWFTCWLLLRKWQSFFIL